MLDVVRLAKAISESDVLLASKVIMNGKEISHLIYINQCETL